MVSFYGPTMVTSPKRAVVGPGRAEPSTVTDSHRDSGAARRSPPEPRGMPTRAGRGWAGRGLVEKDSLSAASYPWRINYEACAMWSGFVLSVFSCHAPRAGAAEGGGAGRCDDAVRFESAGRAVPYGMDRMNQSARSCRSSCLASRRTAGRGNGINRPDALGPGRGVGQP